ncbi:hypothetical protein HPP92_018891 [Vanilla planifolia]|uniref:Uncharacterized protein n=1 Tax=Vanilla planifolia TaxID=51239 RepID=A0A835QBG0_VANPL|nr:hypothetical protein HPP92_018891 [Vanilla planifolia]
MRERLFIIFQRYIVHLPPSNVTPVTLELPGSCFRQTLSEEMVESPTPSSPQSACDPSLLPADGDAAAASSMASIPLQGACPKLEQSELKPELVDGFLLVLLGFSLFCCSGGFDFNVLLTSSTK